MNDKQSVGLEINYSDRNIKAKSSASLTDITAGNHSLVANYKRTVQRPTFDDLNPFRFPASEFP